MSKWQNAKTQLCNTVLLGFFLFHRDFQYRYQQTFLGYLWAFIRPLIGGIPLIIVGQQFKMGENAGSEINYVAYSFSGLMLWQIFWDSVAFPQYTARRFRRVLKRAYVNYWSIMLAGCFYVLFNLLCYTFLLTVALCLFKVQFTATAFLTILSIPLIIMSGLAIGLPILAVTYIYLDLRYSLPLLNSVVIWSVPIVYVTPKEGILRYVNYYNPLTYLIGVPRMWLIKGWHGQEEVFLLCAICVLLCLLMSIRFFLKAIPIAVDQIL